MQRQEASSTPRNERTVRGDGFMRSQKPYFPYRELDHMKGCTEESGTSEGSLSGRRCSCRQRWLLLAKKKVRNAPQLLPSILRSTANASDWSNPAKRQLARSLENTACRSKQSPTPMIRREGEEQRMNLRANSQISGTVLKPSQRRDI